MEGSLRKTTTEVSGGCSQFLEVNLVQVLVAGSTPPLISPGPFPGRRSPGWTTLHIP